MGRTALTTAEFIAKAQAVHGVGTYDYSLVVYRHNAETVTIICPVHGAFEQQAGSHLLTTRAPAGCKRCAYGRMGAAKTGTNEAFIAKAEAVHGVGTYDYSQTNYRGKRERVKIICPVHGAFEQEPQNLLQGYGCAKCSRKHGKLREAIERRTLTTAEFIAKAEAVHGVGTYDYSQTIYSGSESKLTVICPKHGAFEQHPPTHTSAGAGCPVCANHRKTRLTPEQYAAYVKGRLVTLYFVKLSSPTECFFKVGITSRPPRHRHRQLELVTGCSCEVLALYQTRDAAAGYTIEGQIIDAFSHLQYTPQKSFPGESECFVSADEILAIFPK